MIHSVLAGFSDWNLVLDIVNLLPVVSLLIGGIIGFSRGARRLSWTGDSWMFAVFLYAIFLGVLEGVLPEIDPAVPVIVAAVACSAVALFLFTIVKVTLKPREQKFDNLQMQKFLRREERFRIIEREELEEIDPYDEDAREKLEKMQDRRRKKYLDKLDGRPGLLSRLFAAGFEGIDYMFVTSVVIDVLALVIMSTPLSTGLLADFCNLEGFQIIYNEADNSALDYLLIGAVMCSVCIGYKKGVLSSVYALLTAIASIGAAVSAFYIPFSPLVGEGQFLSFVGTMSQGIGGWVGGKLAGVSPIAIPSNVTLIIGQLASGVILFIVFQIIMSILLKLLANAAAISEENAVFHVLDGLLGIVLGAVICMVVLAIVMFLLLLMEEIGWYSAGTALFEDTDLFSVCYESARNLLGPFVTQVRALLPF